jgi:hypothetical protein
MKNIFTQHEFSNSKIYNAELSFRFVFLFLVSILSLHSFSQGKDFQQAANGKSPDFIIKFNNGMLNQSNSRYGEGMAVPQRLILTGLSGSSHTIQLRHQVTKSNVHAFDFLVSWEQAVMAAGFLYNGYQNELNLLFDPAYRCSETISAASSNACTLLTGTLPANQTALVSLGSLPNTPNMPAHSIANAISYFENSAGWLGTGYGARTLEIRADDVITAAAITFDGYDAAGPDYYATYTLTWTSNASDVIIRFGAHIAVGEDSGGYGFGFGASSISGGPYHIRLDDLDGHSIGNQDNQVLVQDLPTGNIILPVNLTGFSGRHTANGNILSWTTAQENGNKGFEVERSVNGREFYSITFIKSQSAEGNSYEKLSYNYTDREPAGNKSYYRLRQVDINGTSKYSSILILSNNMAPALSINRIYGRNNKTILSVDCPLAGKYKVLISDASGRTANNESVQMESGSNEITLSTFGLTHGAYFVKIISLNSREAASYKFVKTW